MRNKQPLSSSRNDGPFIELKGLILGLQEPLAIIVNQLDILHMLTHYFCKVLFNIIVSTTLQSRFFSSLFLIKPVYFFSLLFMLLSPVHIVWLGKEREIIVIPILQGAFYIRYIGLYSLIELHSSRLTPL